MMLDIQGKNKHLPQVKREVAYYKIEEMSKMIKKLLSKLVKFELEAKNSPSKQFQTAPKR